MFNNSRSRVISHRVAAGTILTLYPNSLNLNSATPQKIILGGAIILAIHVSTTKAGTIEVYDYIDGATGLPIKGGDNTRFHELNLNALGTSFALERARGECGSTDTLPAAFQATVTTANNRKLVEYTQAGQTLRIEQEIVCPNGACVHLNAAASDNSLAIEYVPMDLPGRRLKQNLQSFASSFSEGYAFVPQHA